jgi:hypothetical protein
MDAEPRNQQCSTSNSNRNSNINIKSNRESELITTTTFTRFLNQQLLFSSQSSTVQNTNPSSDYHQAGFLFTMSGTTGGSSSTNWNDVLKHGSALGILKPDLVFPSGGGSGSGGSSGSSSGGASGSTAYPSGSVSYY